LDKEALFASLFALDHQEVMILLNQANATPLAETTKNKPKKRLYVAV
jgi:hypothetical protein